MEEAVNLTELNKLEEWLKENNIDYERVDGEWRHQITVPNKKEKSWDVVCQYGSYGYEDGLLEAYGEIVDDGGIGDDVEGWLSAEDVIERVKAAWKNW